MQAIRQQAWEMLIVRHAIEDQYEEVGSIVTTEEMEDMVYGKNLNPNVRQSFTDPQTGQFNPQQVKDFLRQLQAPPENPDLLRSWEMQKNQWEAFQSDLRAGRARIKYENLLIKSTYVTTAEAEQNYHMKNDVAEVKYVYVPFTSMSDSAVTVTDADFRAYYDKNKEKFKSEFTRDMKFVQFPVNASAEDSLEVKGELDKLVADFRNTTEDSVFAANDSYNSVAPYTKYTSSSVPAYISKDELVAGTVKGPFKNGNGYALIKVSKTGREKIDSAKASHILFRWNSTSEADKAEAKERATKVLKDIQAGASFEDKAREFGTDGSASSGGDLGWFYTGTDPNQAHMVKPFEKAVFDAAKPGVLNDVVETDFGYHLIKVTNSKKSKEVNTYTLAEIQHDVTPSDASVMSALNKANEFATDLSGVDNFVKRAEDSGITVYDAKNVGVAERRLNTLPEARQIVQWLFRDADMGEVSTVFDLQDTYVVAVMTGEVEKGYKSLATVKDEITPAVEDEAKAKVIIDKLTPLTGSLEEIAAAYGSAATLHASSDLKLSTNNLPGPGFDAIAIGEAFSPESGKRTKPFAGERGVLIVEMQNKTIAPALQDYFEYKDQLIQAATNKNTQYIGEAIKDKSDITDKRYKFY